MKTILKNLSLLVLLLSTIVSAASPTISNFIEEEDGEANANIVGEFTDDLTKADIADIREGRYIMRQRFEDPFDSEAVLYQLFSGKAGPQAPNLNAFEAGEIPYKALARKKFYKSATPELDEDIEMVFFDGKYVYVNSPEVYVSHSSAFVALTPVANPITGVVTPVAAVPAVTPAIPGASEPAFDEPAPIEEASNQIEEQNSYNQYAAEENLEAVYDRFGYGDDIQEYIGYGFIGIAGGFAVATLLKHTTISEAEDVTAAFEGIYNDNVATQKLQYTDPTDPLYYYENTESARILEGHIKASKKETDARKSARNLLGAGAILAGGIGAVLLTVDF